MDIYTQLREILQAEYDRGATDQEIAGRLGISQQQVNRLRNGARSFDKMRLETLLKLFPKLSLVLNGNTLHGPSVSNINGHGNIISSRDANGNQINLSSTSQEEQTEKFRSGLMQGIIDLDIDDASKVAILRFLDLFKRLDNSDIYLFPAMAKQYMKRPDGLTRRFRRLFDSVDIVGDQQQYCAHCLRTTFASICAENAVPLAVIQSWLGHNSQTVTRIYARIEDMKAKKAAMAKFPEL